MIEGIRLLAPDSSFLIFRRGLPAFLRHYSIQRLPTSYVVTRNGHIISYELSRKRFPADLIRYLLTSPSGFYVMAERPLLLLSCSLEKSLQTFPEPGRISRLAEKFFRIAFFPPGPKYWFEPEPGCLLMAISINTPELERLRENFPLLDRFILQGQSGGLRYLPAHEMAADLRFRSVTEDIMSCQLSDPLRGEYLEAKILELLIEAVALISRHSASLLALPRESEVRAAEHLREALVKVLQQTKAPGMQALQRMAGINEKRLQQLFHYLYGDSIHAYFRRLRMERIYQLVIEGDQPLKEIAFDYGYKDYPSFSHAFRQFYGQPPSALRKS